MVGQRSLEPPVEVRILPPQPKTLTFQFHSLFIFLKLTIPPRVDYSSGNAGMFRNIRLLNPQRQRTLCING